MMKQTLRHSFTLCAVAVLAMGAIAGCEKKTTTTQTAPGLETSTTTITPSPSAERALDNAGEAVADAAVTMKVKTALLADADVKGMQIQVETRNRVVTLIGAVDNARAAERAATLARGIDGVTSVDSRLTVKTAP